MCYIEAAAKGEGGTDLKEFEQSVCELAGADQRRIVYRTDARGLRTCGGWRNRAKGIDTAGVGFEEILGRVVTEVVELFLLGFV